jgi:tetratricopeptide (TPR) repeat protein
MLTKKKKLSKKAIKEDKLVELYYKAYGYFDDNKSQVITYAAVIVVIILAAIWYVNHKNQENNAAAVQLAAVMNYYDNGAYLEAIEGQAGTNVIGLKKIVEQYGSTENGETAKIYLANSYNRLGKIDQAFKYYKDYDGSISMYEAASYAGQAGYYADKKEYNKAADLYIKASRVSSDNVLNADYLLRAGINYLAANEKNEAKNALEKIKKDYDTSPEARQVNQYLAQVD